MTVPATQNLVRSVEFHGPKATPRVVTRTESGKFVDTIAIGNFPNVKVTTPRRHRYKV